VNINILLIICLFCSVLPVSAATKKEFLPRSFRAEFEKQEKSSLTNKIRITKGVMDYKNPGKFKIELKGDNPVIFVENSKKYWYYVPPAFEGEKGELKISNSGKQSITKFFDSLRNGLKSNKIYKVQKNKEGVFIISFLKEAPDNLGIKKVLLSFSGKSIMFKDLRKMEIFYQDKKSVLFVFKNFLINKKFNPTHFIFKKPLNTNVVY